MTTNFSSLPIVDISALRDADITTKESAQLGDKLYEVFATTGFAYLVNLPLSFDHDEVFSIARQFFTLPAEQKMQLSRKSFRSDHVNTYRGYASHLEYLITLTSSDTFQHSHTFR